MGDPGRPRLAACTVCRRSKIKCDWAPGEDRCKRCVQLNRECVRPDVHVGRQKGIKNKRVGLDKALYQVEQAVKRVNAGGEPRMEDDRVMTRLRELLYAAEGSGFGTSAHREYSQSAATVGSGGDMEASSSEDESHQDSTLAGMPSYGEENLAVDDAENPLQLLARASYFQPAEEPRKKDTPPQLPTVAVHQRPHLRPPEKSRVNDVQRFFSSAKANLDVGDDIDPISLGLVTMEEADTLFSFFHSKLAHTRWGLDPRIYTMEYTRSRSCFLLASIMAGSALFMPSAAALSRRLSNHVRTLADRVMTRRHRSVEIVLAFMINVPWMSPGVHSTSDETCQYVAEANTVAIDLSLHKVLVSPEMLGPGSRMTLARGECIDPRAALEMDGHEDVDPGSERGVLLLRGRERAWLALFVLERGMALARGRPFIVPKTRFLKDCDNWHKSQLAEAQDAHLLSMAVLRRDLDDVLKTVRSLCDSSQAVASDGSLIAQSIESAIENFFNVWYSTWGVSMERGPERRLPPYVEILVTHTRLSIYGGVINHPTAPLEVRRFFRTAGLSSALNVLRTAIQGEAQLQSMPNNTTIMISFAACFALTLSAYATTTGSNLAPSVRKLIDEAGGVLERVGAVTEHRNGLSTMYGQHLRYIVRRAARGRTGRTVTATSSQSQISPPAAPIPAMLDHSPMGQEVTMEQAQPHPHHHHPQHPQQHLLWPETLPLSTMSDDQIMQVLNQPGNEFAPSFQGLSWDDMSNFDWLHWPEFGS